MHRIYFLLIILFIGCSATSNTTSNTNNTTTSGIAGKTKGMKKYEGFFNFYYDKKSDKIFLEVDKFDQEFIYVNSLAAGVGSNDIGLDRNQLGNTRILKFERRGPKILLIEPNYQYRAITDNLAEKKSVKDAFAQSIISGFELVTEEEGNVLINITDFLMRDAHGVADRLKSTKQGNYSLDKSMSAMYLDRTKNFPKNSEFEVTLTFTGDPKGGYIRSVTPTSSNVTVRMHHSMVELPDDNYKPRVFDPRAGYYSISYSDYASPISEDLEKKFICRHRLEKKNPHADMSEAVEPIVYYLDPGTPEPIRSALLDGASWWNQAFEAAGYKDGFQVKILPEDADPLDVRYNVINWVHRSTRGWSYGTSVRDPRTGEIIKGHVLLGSLRVRQDYLIAEGLLAPYEEGTEVSDEMEKMALARLRQLSAHEVGHTLGLVHSYSSSTEGRASVMDYPHPYVKIHDGKLDLSDAYDENIGEWDKVAITYGYKEFTEAENEKPKLNEILNDAFSEGLSFISDQDARPQGGAHPFAHLWDNGENAAEELDRVLDVRQIALKNFGENNIKIGETYASLEEVLVPIYFFHRYQTEAAVKIIGGLNYSYALRGDGQLVTELVNRAQAEKALEVLLKTISPEHLTLSENIIEKLPPRTLGSSRNREVINIRTGLTFDALGAAESAANLTLSLLFHPSRVQRLVEYKARDNKQLGFNEMIDKLVSNTWKKPYDQSLEGEVGRTVNGLVLHYLMQTAISKDVSEQVNAIALLEIEELHSSLRSARATNDSQKAHFNLAMKKIERFINEPDDYEGIDVPDAPAGSPIGMGYLCE